MLPRHVWVWAFLLGVVTLTAVRPLLRREPAPPPVLGTLPAFRWTDQTGSTFGSGNLAGYVWVAGFFSTDCDPDCPLMAAMARLDRRYREEDVRGVRLVSFSVDPQTTPERLRAYANALGATPERWTLLTADADAIRELVDDGFAPALGDGARRDLARGKQLVIVDANGAVRGSYDVIEREDRYPGFADATELGLDEVFHRSRHVLEQASEETPRPPSNR